MPDRFHSALTKDNAALLLVDHQIGLFTGVRDFTVSELKHNVTSLAKLGMPFATLVGQLVAASRR